MPDATRKLNYSPSSWVRILGSLFFIGLLVWALRQDYHEVARQIRQARIAIYALSLLLFSISLALLGYRLKIILNAQGHRFSFKQSLALTYIGYFFTNFLPTAIGGDIVKGFYISQKSQKKVEAYTAVFVDRITGAVSFAFIAVVMLMLRGRSIEEPSVHYAVYTLAGVLVALGVLASHRQLMSRLYNVPLLNRILAILKLDTVLKRIYNAAHGYRTHKKTLARAFSVSIVGQIVNALCLYFLAKSINNFVPIPELLLVVPVVAVFSMLPFSLGGLGLREGALVFLLGPGIGYPSATTIAVLYLSLFLIASCIGGLVYALRGWLL